MYTPKQAFPEDPLESFTVHMVYSFLPTLTDDPLLVQRHLENLYPGKAIVIFPIEKTKNSLIYSWKELNDNLTKGL